MQKLDKVHPFFSIIPIYLGQFYQGISTDSNTSVILNAFAQIDEQTLDSIDQMLVFWFFWSMDRLAGHYLLNDAKVQYGFKTIWSINEDRQKELIQIFDGLRPEEQPSFLWKLVQKLLGDKSLSPLFALVHLRNAQMFVISENGLGKFVNEQ